MANLWDSIKRRSGSERSALVPEPVVMAQSAVWLVQVRVEGWLDPGGRSNLSPHPIRLAEREARVKATQFMGVSINRVEG